MKNIKSNIRPRAGSPRAGVRRRRRGSANTQTRVGVGIYTTLIVVCITLLGASLRFGLSNTVYPDHYPPDFEQAVVERIVDSDTIIVYSGIRVRLIGVEAPEMGFGNAEYEVGATEATEFVRALLPPGSTVWLEQQGNDTDRFGRLRRYVWIELPQEGENVESARVRNTLNGLLVEYGHAEVRG